MKHNILHIYYAFGEDSIVQVLANEVGTLYRHCVVQQKKESSLVLGRMTHFI